MRPRIEERAKPSVNGYSQISSEAVRPPILKSWNVTEKENTASEEMQRQPHVTLEAVLEVETSTSVIAIIMTATKKYNDVKNENAVNIMNDTNVVIYMTGTNTTVPIAEEVTRGFNSEAVSPGNRKKG